MRYNIRSYLGRAYRLNKQGNLKKGRYVCRDNKTYFRHLKDDKTQTLDSGYTIQQTYVGLAKAWLGYTIAHVEFDEERMIYYAANIQKLQRELVDASMMDPSYLANFPNLRMWAHAEPGDYARHLRDEYTAYRQESPELSDRQWLTKLYQEQGVEI